MSEFIREVDEEYRRERVANFLKRFQVPIALAVILVIAGAGGWRWYVDHRISQAQSADTRYQTATQQARSGQETEAEAGFKALAANGPAGYATLSRLRAAEVLGGQDPEAAAKALDAIASDDSAGSAALRDLARYRGALLRLDISDPKAFEAQYGRFALDTFTLHDGMRELLALASLRRGDGAKAGKYLDDILIDPLAPPALRNRAQAYRELVNAGPATTTTSAIGPAAIVPITPASSKTPAPVPAEDNIAPVETLPAPGANGAAAAAAPAPTPPPASIPGAPTPAAPAPAAQDGPTH